MPDAPLPPSWSPPPTSGASGTPIIVNASPAPAQLTSALRTLFTVLGTSAGVLGYAHAGVWLGQAALVVGPFAAVVAIVLGQIHIRRAEQQKAAMASALPDQIASIK